MTTGEIIGLLVAAGGLLGGGGLGGYLLSRQKQSQEFTIELYKQTFELVEQLQQERDECREQAELERGRRIAAEAVLSQHNLDLPK